MQIHQLAVFKKVADTKNFSRAGDDLYLSQSTVSTHIRNLEEYFGRKLFDRMGKEAVLTPFGERLYRWAEHLLELHGQAVDDLKDYTNEMSGTLHIAASTVPSQYLAPTIMAAFHKLFPAVTFVIRQGSSEQIADLLLRGQADLGIMGEQYHQERIAYVPFHKEQLVLITPRDWSLCDPVTLEQVMKHPHIFRSQGSGTQATLERLLRRTDMRPAEFKTVAYLDSVQAVKQAVRDGLGAAFISEIAARDSLEHGMFNVHRVSELCEERPFYFAHSFSRTLAPFVHEFIRVGREIYRPK